MSWVTVAVGVGSAFAGGIQAKKARDANEAGLASEQDRISNLQGEIDIARGNAAQLREERDVPSELFAELLTQHPELLQRILPQLTDISIDTTDRLADVGSDQFLRLREKIAPGTTALQADTLSQINSLNPENLGAEEIAGITRKLSPLLPAGTLNPESGAVAGGTTTPVSLYRNLISSQYGERRKEFISASSAFTGSQNNAAVRQQVSAAGFLNSSLDRAFNTSAALASADIGQQQLDIDAQEAFIRLAASGLASTFDPSANNQLIASGTSSAITGLGAAAGALANRNGGKT